MTGRVDIIRSRALLALRRLAVVRSGPRVALRWLARTLAGVSLGGGLLGLVGLMTLPALVVGSLLILAAASLTGLVLDFYAQHRWSALPDLLPLEAALKGGGAGINLADYLTWEAAALIERLGRDQASAIPRLTLPTLLVSANQLQTAWILQRLGMLFSLEDVAELAKQEQSDSIPDLPLLLEHAAEAATKDGRPLIDDADLVAAVFRLDPSAVELLERLGLSSDDVGEAARWLRRGRERLISLSFWSAPSGPGIAQDWTSGYTPFLQNFAPDLTQAPAALGHSFQLIGRDAELAQLERTLAKTRGHNVLLVGEAGIGRDSLVLGLAQKVTHGDTVAALRYQHVLRLDLNLILAGATGRGEIEERLMRVFAEAVRAGNTILFIPDIHLLVGGGDRVAGVDATDLLVKVLRSPNLRLIATTTPAEFQSRLAAQTSLVGMLERINLTDLPSGALLEILEDAAVMAEAESGLFFTLPALKTIVEIATRYAKDQPGPASALNLLADMTSAATEAAGQVITPAGVKAVLAKKLNVPLEAAAGEEREQLLNLEVALHETVVDQEEAIGAVATALRRARAGIASGQRPIASLLFLGPTGVGKTETAKALARVYFQGEDRILRFDMSEYSQPDSLVRLIGAPAAGGTKIGGLLTDGVHDRPFTLILLDEFEKAHPQILNLFLQVLDDGRLTDGTGRVIDFTNTIIIATSNAGAELIRQSIAAGEDQEARRKNLLNHLQETGIYKPELLNRFDGVIAFRPLAPEHVRAIVELMLKGLRAKVQAEHQIALEFTPDLVDALAAVNFDPQFGARPVRRLIQDKVESWLANQILAGTIQKGSTLSVSAPTVGLVSQLAKSSPSASL